MMMDNGEPFWLSVNSLSFYSESCCDPFLVIFSFDLSPDCELILTHGSD